MTFCIWDAMNLRGTTCWRYMQGGRMHICGPGCCSGHIPLAWLQLAFSLCTVQNTSAFWELLGAVSALSPPQDPEQSAL